ncbi:MAG: peptidoglycan-binding protein, partial [Clostridia bacterium]|nr:peptidoglycan-binding protein [Clostridia bacterium]
YLQILINRIRRVFVTIPGVEEDGIFGNATRNAVREFQRLFGFTVDGVVGRETWNGMNRVFGSVASGCLDNGVSETGRTLRYGSSGQDVRRIQEKLMNIRTSRRALSRIAIDGNFGRNTENAVITFQRIFGLTPDGVVGSGTRTRISAIDRAVRAGCLPTPFSREGEPFSLTEEALPAFSTIQGADRGESKRNGSPWPKDCPWANEEEWESR